MDLDRVGRNFLAKAVERLFEVALRYDVTAAFDQQTQDAHLLARETQGMAGDRYLDALAVERNVAEGQISGLQFAWPPQQRGEPGAQLGQRKWLHQIVVSPRIEPGHAIRHLAPAGEDENRRNHPALAQVAHQLEPVAIG